MDQRNAALLAHESRFEVVWKERFGRGVDHNLPVVWLDTLDLVKENYSYELMEDKVDHVASVDQRSDGQVRGITSNACKFLNT